MYLIDTNVLSEARQRDKANAGVVEFFGQAAAQHWALYLSVVTMGELRRGVELVRHRGDTAQARLLEAWLDNVSTTYASAILEFDQEAAQVWGRLRVPDPSREIDKQIAATALVNDLIVVTRNTADFIGTGVALNNPFA